LSPIVDVHAHLIPESCLDLERTGRRGTFGVRLEGQGEGAVFWIDGTRRTGSAGRRQRWTSGEATRRVYELEIRRAEMRAMGIDVQALSVPPFLYFYGLEPEETAACARRLNDGIAEACAAHPDAFVGLATVPLNDPALAIVELDRALALPGMRGVEIGTHVDGRQLDDPAFFPFFEAVAARGAVLFLHPHTPHRAYGWATDRFDRYYLRNLIGNPLETSLGVAALVFGGILERLPELNVILPHAGGNVPFIRGRWEWGWSEIPDCQTIERSPGEYLDRLYYDTIAHFDPALRYLGATVGTGRILLGTDHPFDIGDPTPLETIDRSFADPAARRAIAGETAARLLRVDGAG
jgi:aminocarboxymuconate-semialdehyde decarboxylase